ncbi:hypothetical protein NHX12_007500 [Muraenolepis orangiensis]|uniref:Uncharacterized protein n=1 Tax=Muraenolepis orangiensis TaxID=630683 RepID=A0A9Q0DQ26_9TELE|nr:hypothetical protein NHX12_007500 [Muraenolepis orangiensis]
MGKVASEYKLSHNSQVPLESAIASVSECGEFGPCRHPAREKHGLSLRSGVPGGERTEEKIIRRDGSVVGGHTEEGLLHEEQRGQRGLCVPPPALSSTGRPSCCYSTAVPSQRASTEAFTEAFKEIDGWRSQTIAPGPKERKSPERASEPSAESEEKTCCERRDT